jgi:hypothetical protein
MHRDILRPKINKSVTSHFSFWLPALFSVVIAITYAECTYQCSLEWFYFCLGMLLFSYALPLFFMLFIYITLDLKAIITQKLPTQASPDQ